MKGRILCLTSSFPKWVGDSTTPFVNHLAQDLCSHGWQVDVLAPHASETAIHEKIGSVAVSRFRYLWPVQLETVCYGSGIIANARKSKSNYLKIPAFVAAELLAVGRKLASRRYDLLHSHWILPQSFIGALTARPLRIPHVATVHGGDIFSLKNKYLVPFKQFSLRHADAVTVNSSATESAVKKLVKELEAIHRIPMGVSLRSVDPQAPEVKELRARFRRREGPLLIFVGRLITEKGVEDLIRAVKLLETSLPDVTALIVGDGQDRSALKNLARQLGIQSRINFVGWVKPERVGDFLAAADLFVGPSRTAPEGWIEAQGLTFLEAMVARTPVIATRIGGIVDTVRHERTGLLVDECAPEQLATSVIRLCQDSSLADRLADEGHRLATREYSRQGSAERFSKLFSDLLGHPQSYR